MSNTTTTALAVWGAVVSTALSAHTVWQNYRNGRRLVVTPWFNARDGLLVFNLENVGGERLTVQFVGGVTDNGAQFVLQHDAFPITLEPSDVKQILYKAAELRDIKQMRTIRRLCARTAGSKVWFASRKDTNEALQEMLQKGYEDTLKEKERSSGLGD